MGECNPSMASGYGSPILNCVGLFLSGVIRKRNTNGEKGEFPTRKLDLPENPAGQSHARRSYKTRRSENAVKQEGK